MKLNFILFAALLFTIVSCSSPESKLIGTWKVIDVETHFDDANMSPEMILQVVEMQKGTFFKIINDSVIIIMSSNNTHEARWSYNSNDNTVSYYFDTPDDKNKLGIFQDGNIVSESNTPAGKMIVKYGREK